MKQLAVISFSFFYLLASVGVAVNFHYCLGRLQSVDVLIAKSNCCCDDEGQMMNCCDDESYFFQLEAEEKVVPTQLSIPSVALLTAIFTPQVLESPDSAPPVWAKRLDLPPPEPVSTWLLHCAPLHYA
ncbi:MAG: hypothetical protein AAFQ87_15510 [Bacteroidota bacterium]